MLKLSRPPNSSPLKTKEDLKAAAPLIQKIRSIDQRIAEQVKAISESSATCGKEEAKIKADKQARLKEQDKRTEAEKTLEAVEQFLKEHAQDEWLIGGLAGIEEQFSNLLARQKEITQKEDDLKNADTAMAKTAKKLDDTTMQSAIRKLEIKEAAKNLQQGKDALNELLGDRLLREYRAEKESLQKEKEYLARIAALEDHRANLEDGKPCPLCGSTEHPYAEGNVPVPDEIEQKIESLTKLIDRVEDQEVAIKKLEEAESAALKNLNDSEKLETNAANEKKATEKTLLELKDGLGKLRNGFAELKLAVSGKLLPLGITEIPEDQVSSLLESLKSRLNAWKEQVRKKSEIEKQISVIDSEMKRLDAVIETQSTVLTEKQGNLERLKKEHASGKDERQKLYGDKKPDDEEIRLNKAIADAEDAEKKGRSLNSELQQKLTTAKSHVESLKKRIEQREPELKKGETDFLAALPSTGFEDEKLFLEAKLPIEERESLSSRAKEMDNAQTELKAKQKDRETRLVTEQAKKLTDNTLEELESQFKGYEDSLKELRDTVASCTNTN